MDLNKVNTGIHFAPKIWSANLVWPQRELRLLGDLEAVQFYKMMSNGRTAPMLVGAEDDQGHQIDVVAKFQGRELPPSGLVREALGAMLAAELGLLCPEPYVVRASALFIDSLRVHDAGLADRLQAGSGLGYASEHLSEGFQTWPSSRPLDGSARLRAAEVLAFDCWFQNADRKIANPNLLWNGINFAVIDHELAFMTEGILFWRPPWEENSVNNIVDGHVFGSSLKGTSPKLDRIVTSLKSISDERLSQYFQALPLEWVEDGASARKAIQFIKDVRDNADAAAQEVLRALK